MYPHLDKVHDWVAGDMQSCETPVMPYEMESKEDENPSWQM